MNKLNVIISIILSSLLAACEAPGAPNSSDGPALSTGLTNVQQVVTCDRALIRLRPLTLTTNGSVDHSAQVPPDMPRDLLAMSAPLFPGAQRSNARVHPDLAVTAGANGGYQKTGMAKYRLRSSIRTVVRWYLRHMDTCGFGRAVESYQDSAGDPVLVFRSPSFQNLDLSIGVQATSRHSCLVLYYATAVVTATRPAGSLVPASAKRVIVDDATGSTGSGAMGYRLQLRNAALVAGLAELANEEPGTIGPRTTSRHPVPLQLYAPYIRVQFGSGPSSVTTFESRADRPWKFGVAWQTGKRFNVIRLSCTMGFDLANPCAEVAMGDIVGGIVRLKCQQSCKLRRLPQPAE